MLQYGTGFARGHLAGQQRRHLLHPRRIAPAVFQTQRSIRRKPPFAASLAVTSCPLNGDRPKPALKTAWVLTLQSAQWLLAHRTARRSRFSLLLSCLFSRYAQQFTALLFQLQFQIPQVLIASPHKLLHLLF